MIEYCLHPIPNRSKYANLQPRLRQFERGHIGKHDEFPYLRSIAKTHPAVFEKIKRDATHTTGAAWNSEDAGPNRILRWVMLLNDEELLHYGIHMADLKPQVVAKLREKAADYVSCMEVAKKLTWLIYQMPGAPEPTEYTVTYLENIFGPMNPGSTVCLVCREPLPFALFSLAARGKAEIETAHSNPRYHNPDNVGFAHRACNIAQGAKTLPEFYDWIEKILNRVRADQSS